MQEILVRWRYFKQFVLDFLLLQDDSKDSVRIWRNQLVNLNMLVTKGYINLTTSK